jgi:SAM-dependent methyltransferase
MFTGNNHPDSATLERIVPDNLRSGEMTGEDTLELHLERYQFAKQNLVGGRLLDIACGVGYGTALLSRSPLINFAIGVDVDNAAIQYASRRYRLANVAYICANAHQFSGRHQFANIVSLETIEHVEDPHGLFRHFVDLLAPGGRLIASVPVTPSVDGNPHHKSNFSDKSFRKLGDASGLTYLSSLDQVQRFRPWAVAMRQEARARNMRRNLAEFYVSNPSHLFLRLWSTLRHGFVNKYLTVVWEKQI